MNKSSTLELHFIDGKPDGMLTAEIMVNWTGHILSTPRTQIVKALGRKEASYTGVYVLFGEKDDGPCAYIGEAEELRSRLRNHIDRKDWWTSAVLITTSENKLNKSHAKYLEARLIEIAGKGQMPLDNGNTPKPPNLSEAHTASMETFLETLLMVLLALQIDMFSSNKRESAEVSTSPTKQTFELVTKKYGIQATAVLKEDGEFIVQEGSSARAKWEGGKWHAGYRKLYEELVDGGDLTLKDNRRVFETSYAFKSATAAATVVNGRSTNGLIAWKVEGTGETYKDWEQSEKAKEEKD